MVASALDRRVRDGRHHEAGCSRALSGTDAFVPDAWSDERIDAVWDQFDQGTQRAILRLVRSTSTVAQSTISALPALILWGDRDPWYPPALADAYAARIPGATIERLEDAGHWPWLDRSDLVERVAAFLEEANE